MGRAQGVTAKRLWCLHEDEIRTRHRRDDASVRDAFHGIDHGECGNRGVGTVAHRRDDRRVQRARCKRTGGIVDHDDVGIGRHQREAGPYGVRAGRATRRAANAVGWFPLRVVGNDDHDAVARVPRARDRAIEHGAPAEARELLGRAEPAPAPGRDHDRPRRHARNVPRSHAITAHDDHGT
jgi:hypothetical protein